MCVRGSQEAGQCCADLRSAFQPLYQADTVIIYTCRHGDAEIWAFLQGRSYSVTADPKPRFSLEPRLCGEVMRESLQVEKPKVFLKFEDGVTETVTGAAGRWFISQMVLY